MDYTRTLTFKSVQRLEAAYADVCEKRTQAYDKYQQYVDKFYARQISRQALEEAYAMGTQYDNQAAQLYAELNQAKVIHLEFCESQEQECECTPISTCEPCAQRARNSDLEF